jgi:hypothetical protein
VKERRFKEAKISRGTCKSRGQEDANDQARETIKNVNVDSSGRLEVEDWVQLHSLLRAGKSQPVYVLPKPSPSLFSPISLFSSPTTSQS